MLSDYAEFLFLLLKRFFVLLLILQPHILVYSLVQLAVGAIRVVLLPSVPVESFHVPLQSLELFSEFVVPFGLFQCYQVSWILLWPCLL